MKKLFLAACLCFAAAFVHAQSNGAIKGKLVDTSGSQPVSEATISLMLLKDSSLVSFTISDKKGLFELKNLPAGDYELIISYTGYQLLRKSVSLQPDKMMADAGELILEKEYKSLSEVVVQDAPVRISGDTIAFKADAFKTKPNATVEDVLKKLPGVQVDKDGNVTAMGENVQKVYVDGKEFFGNDPKLATKNITADMVDQIQVYDDMSDQAKFTKIDDGSRSKAINIKLKNSKNKGQFGKAMAAGGTDGRYEGSLSFNNFKGSQRISFLSATNNMNKQGFSFSDIISSQGGMGQFSRGDGGMMGGGMMSGMGGAGAMMMNAMGGGFGVGQSGISTAKSAGLNYNDQWGSKIDFRSSYFFSQSDNLLNQKNYRQTFFPSDSSTEAFTESVSRNRNANHRINIRGEYKIDSMNSLLYTANLNIQQSNGMYSDSSYTYSNALNNYLAITGSTSNGTERDGMNYSGELLYRRRFSKPGRTFTLGWRNGYNESESESLNQAPNRFYKPDGSMLFSRIQNQNSFQETESNNNTITTSVTEAVGNNKIIELNYAYSDNQSTSDRKTFDYNSGSGKYDVMNMLQTNYFKNSNISNRAGINYRVQDKKYNYQLGMAVQFAELISRSVRAATGVDTTLSQKFTNLFPSASFNYNASRTKSIKINYRGRTNAPSISQLQDVPDLSNPLQVKTGNPALKQEFMNNISLNYNTFNMLSFRFFASSVNLNITGNKIVNSIDSFGRSVIITKPVNMDGAYNLTAFTSVGFPIKKLKGSNVNFTTIMNYNRDISLVYKETSITNRLMLSQAFGFNYNKNKFDMGITGRISYNSARYSLQQNLNTEFLSHTYTADFTYTLKRNFILSTDFDYLVNSGRSDGFNQNIPLWNAGIGKQFLKNKAAELKFTVYDILNQNKRINRTIGDNYLEDSETNVIRRFFMLSLTYNLNRMGGKGQSQMPQNMQRMMERGAKQFQRF